MNSTKLAAGLYIQTILREEIRPALDHILRRADDVIEQIGSRKKTAALVLLGVDLIASAAVNQNLHHSLTATIIPLVIVAPPAYALEYYCVKGFMSAYHRMKKRFPAHSGPASGIDLFYFRS